jgi:hypothetical protein
MGAMHRDDFNRKGHGYPQEIGACLVIGVLLLGFDSNAEERL